MLRRSKTDERKGSAPPAAGAHILLVSDEPDVTELMTRLLDHAGFTTSSAAGVYQATRKVLDSDPPVSLTLIDFRSGGTSLGLKLLDLLRDSDKPVMADMRVIITTDVDENHLFSWQSGVDGFMVRPYRSDTLVEEISATLQRTGDERAAHRRDELRQFASQPHSQAADA